MIKALYIHVPFCKTICPYCDFFKRVSKKEMMGLYLEGIKEEILLSKKDFGHLETIYIGGGTPTSFIYLKELLELVKENINLKEIKEYTIETTPRDLSDSIIDLLAKSGINRVSLGVETFSSRTLNYLNRKKNHFDEVKSVIKRLNKDGITNINLDFIYGLPYENLFSVRRNLRLIKKLNVPHLSYYDLIIEDKTILKHDLDIEKVSLPTEDINIKMRDMIEKKLKKFGFVHYEISNYAKPGFSSLHNISYWTMNEYMGLGPGAHSFYNNKRYSNTKNLKTYALLSINHSLKEIREYYPAEPEKEYFIMGLRQYKGVSISYYNELFKTDLFTKFPEVNDYLKNGMLEINGDYLRLTDYGMHFANKVFEIFI